MIQKSSNNKENDWIVFYFGFLFYLYALYREINDKCDILFSEIEDLGN